MDNKGREASVQARHVQAHGQHLDDAVVRMYKGQSRIYK